MNMIKKDSKWNDGGGKIFRIIDIVQIEGYTWIHYIKENARDDETREYSCYLESFLSRFTQMPE